MAYHLTRKWSKEKILTEYLNSIYFGNGAYGIESAARTYFGDEPDHKGCGDARQPPVRVELQPARGRAARRASSPRRARYDPVAHPVGRDGAGATSCCARCSSRAASRAPSTTTRRPASRCRPRRARRRRDVRHRSRAVLHHLGAPAARRPLRRPSGRSRAACKVRTTLDLDLQNAAAAARSTRYLPLARRPDGGAGRHRQQDRRGPRDGRRPRLRQRRRSTSRPRASASRARRSSRSCSPQALRQGIVTRARCGRRASETSTCPGTQRQGEFVVNNYEGAYAGIADARQRADVLRQLASTPRSASRSAPRRSRGWPGAWASARRSRTTCAITLGGLQAGRHARSTWRTPTRRSPPAGARVSGSLGAERRRPGRHRLGRKRDQGRQDASSDEQDARSTRVLARSSPTRGRDPADGRHRTAPASARAVRRLRRRQDRHDRELRRRLVRRLHRQAARSPSGSATRTAQADADRVRRRAGRGRHLPRPDLARLHRSAANTIARRSAHAERSRRQATPRTETTATLPPRPAQTPRPATPTTAPSRRRPRRRRRRRRDDAADQTRRRRRRSSRSPTPPRPPPQHADAARPTGGSQPRRAAPARARRRHR